MGRRGVAPAVVGVGVQIGGIGGGTRSDVGGAGAAGLLNAEYLKEEHILLDLTNFGLV